MIDCITISPNGTILEVEPKDYQSIKGIDISNQEHIKELLVSKRPTGFHSIKSVEGIYAVDCDAPVFNESGEFIGAASIMINATKFFSQAVGPIQPGRQSQILGNGCPRRDSL